MASTPKRRSASKRRVGRRRARPLAGNLADPAPLATARPGTPRGSAACAGRLPSRRTQRAYWFSTSARPASSCSTHISTPCRMSSGSKPVTTIGTRYCRGEGPIFVHAHDGADVAGRQKPLHAVPRRREDRLDGRRHQHMGDQQRKIRPAPAGRLHDGHGVGRGRGLEADGKEHHLPLGVLLGQRHGVHRRVDDPHVAPFRLHGQQVVGRAGHAQHVAERAEDHLRPRGDRHRLVDELQRRDAHRAAGAVDQRDLRAAASRPGRSGRSRGSGRRRPP